MDFVSGSVFHVRSVTKYSLVSVRQMLVSERDTNSELDVLLYVGQTF